MSNKLILAGAGTGKTTYIVNEALKNTERVLITTFTIKCRDEIKDKILEINGYIPKNIIIQTWFSFLLEHGIYPYKKSLNITKVNGLCFVDGKSGFRYLTQNKKPVYYGEKDFKKYYFDDLDRIYSDKISKLVLKIDDASKGLVFSRINKVFKKIYIDEVQDMVGYDLEIIKRMANFDNKLIIVGDPRQNVYNTHCDSKYTKYSNGKIDLFVKKECSNFVIDDTTLHICRRCHKDIVDFCNIYYKEYIALESLEKPFEECQGVYVVRTRDLEDYLTKYKPVQLRYSKKTKVNSNFRSINYRNAKGCTFKRTIIYPTNDMKEYLKNGKKIPNISTKNAIYVALSRAIDSVAFVYDGTISDKHKINVWNNKT